MRAHWLSRKFLLSLSAQIAAMLVLIWPGHESEIVRACESVTALLVLLGSTLGYVHTEGAIDREGAGAGGSV